MRSCPMYLASNTAQTSGLGLVLKSDKTLGPWAAVMDNAYQLVVETVPKSAKHLEKAMVLVSE